MRSFVPGYELKQAATLDEALRLLADGWHAFAGGTDVMVLFELGALLPRRWVSIWNIPGLRRIHASPEVVVLGATTTYSDIRRSDILTQEFPLLVRAACDTGSIATQNRGTIGGNIANASPAADTPPALLVYDAELELVSQAGVRRVSYAGFHSGYKTMDLGPGELISAIHLPRRRESWREYYRKVGTRKAQAISKVCLAAAARVEEGTIIEARLSAASVAPVPLRCTKTEALIRGQKITPELVTAAADQLGREIAPIDDVRSTALYRRRVAGNLLREFLGEVCHPNP